MQVALHAVEGLSGKWVDMTTSIMMIDLTHSVRCILDRDSRTCAECSAAAAADHLEDVLISKQWPIPYHDLA
jgi:hypothetical protein